MMVMAKVKVAAVVTGGLCLAIGIGAAVVAAIPGEGHDAASTAPSTQPSASAVMLPGGGRVELVGISDYPSKDKSWWQPDGSLLATSPCGSFGDVGPIAVLITEGNPPLQQAVAAALSRPTLQVISPKEYEKRPQYADLMVFDHYQPKSLLNNGMYLYFASAPPHWPSQTLAGQSVTPASKEALVVSNWKRDHVVLRDVPLDKLAIVRAMHLTPPSNAEVLAESLQGPLIVFEQGRGQEHMVFAFGGGDANWGTRADFQSLISNSVKYLMQTAHDGYRQFQFAMRLSNLPADTGYGVAISPDVANMRGGTGVFSNGPATKDGRPVPGLITAQWNLKPTVDVATIRLLLALDAKETLELERDGSVTDEAGPTVRQFLPASTSEQVGPSGKQTVLTLSIATGAAGSNEWSVKAIDITGKEHASAFRSAVDVDGKTKPTVGFALPLEQVGYFILTARPYRYEVTFTNVPLQQGKRADVKGEIATLHP